MTLLCRGHVLTLFQIAFSTFNHPLYPGYVGMYQGVNSGPICPGTAHSSAHDPNLVSSKCSCRVFFPDPPVKQDRFKSGVQTSSLIRPSNAIRDTIYYKFSFPHIIAAICVFLLQIGYFQLCCHAPPFLPPSLKLLHLLQSLITLGLANRSVITSHEGKGRGESA